MYALETPKFNSGMLAHYLTTELGRMGNAAGLAEELIQVRPVQCYEIPAVAMIIHATEHFSYHVGQIVFYTKMIKGVDMAFYAGQDLDAKDANE